MSGRIPQEGTLGVTQIVWKHLPLGLRRDCCYSSLLQLLLESCEKANFHSLEGTELHFQRICLICRGFQCRKSCVPITGSAEAKNNEPSVPTFRPSFGGTLSFFTVEMEINLILASIFLSGLVLLWVSQPNLKSDWLEHNAFCNYFYNYLLMFCH